MYLNILKESLISSLNVSVIIYMLNFAEYYNSSFNSEVLYPIVLMSIGFYPFVVFPIITLFFLFVWKLVKPIIETEKKYANFYAIYSSSKGRVICLMFSITLGIYFGLN